MKRTAGQMSKADALRFTVEALAQSDDSLIAKARKLERAWAKGGEVLQGAVAQLGETIQAVIRGLPMDRCDQLTIAEVAAFMGTNERNAERHIGIFLKPPRQRGKGPGDRDYHIRNKHDRRYWQWFYHLKAVEAFLDEEEELEHGRRRAAGLRQRHTPSGIAKRQERLEAEMREVGMVRAVLKKDRLDLVRTTLAEHPMGTEVLADLAALKAKLAGMGVSLEDLIGLQTFVMAQVADITTSVVARQPWLLDAEGRLTDHAWWTIDNDAESIRDDLVAGGTVVHMPLVEALQREWRPGDAYAVWSAISDMAAQRSIDTRRRHLAAMRQAQDEGKGKDLPVKQRVRS